MSECRTQVYKWSYLLLLLSLKNFSCLSLKHQPIHTLSLNNSGGRSRPAVRSSFVFSFAFNNNPYPQICHLPAVAARRSLPPLPGLLCSDLLRSAIDGLMLPWVLALDLLGLGLAPLRMLSFIFFVCFMYFMYFCQATPSYGCVYQKLTLVIPPTLVWCCCSLSQLLWCMSCFVVACYVVYVRCNLLCSNFLHL